MATKICRYGSDYSTGINDQSAAQSHELDFSKELDRLMSFFENNWTKSYVNIHLMAKIGFYFYQKPDKTKCYFCDLVMRDWEEGENILEVHLQNSNNCPLLRRQPTNNIPISDVELNEVLPQIMNDVCGAGGYKAPPVSPFKHIEWSSENKRLKSFDSWPKALKQMPRDLADAGFFYTNRGDRVVCFSCGIGLKDWEEEDVPWVEHAKAVKSCIYMEFVKGKEFMKKVREVTQSPVETIACKETNINNNDTSVPPLQEEKLCKICYDTVADVAFIPCGHVATCRKCSLSMKDCPICRKHITERIIIFFS